MKRWLNFGFRHAAALALWLALATPAWANRVVTTGLETNNFTGTEWIGSSGAGLSIQSTTKHSGVYAIRINQAASTAYGLLGYTSKTSGSLFYREYRYFTTRPNTNVVFVSLSSGGAGNDINYINSGTTWQISSVGGATSLGTAVLATGQWYRFELDVLLSDTVGTVTGRLYSAESTTPLETLSLTSQDTLPGSIGQAYIGALGTSNTCDFYLDDIAINDEAGSAPHNTSVGPGKISLLTPASDSSVTWERTGGGATNADSVNDEPGTPDDTMYNSEAVTLNSVDRLNVGTLHAEVPANATMRVVHLYARVGSNQISAARMQLKMWDEAASLTNGGSINCETNGWQLLTAAQTIAYDASAKTKANVEAFDFGYENFTDDATRPRRVSELWANVEWIEAAGAAAAPGITAHICTAP